MKMFTQKPYHHVNVNVHCVYPRLQHKPSVDLETQQSPTLAFLLSIKKELTRCQFFQLVQTLLFWQLPEKILSILFFWKFTSLMTSLAVI